MRRSAHTHSSRPPRDANVTRPSRVTIDGRTYPASIVVLPNCSLDAILGIDFLTDNGGVIDLQTKSKTFPSDHSTTPQQNPEPRPALRMAEDHVTLPPRASLMVTVYCEGAAPEVGAIVKSDQRLLLDRGVSIAKGIVWFTQRKSHVFFTAFTEEYQHLNKGAAIALLEETQEASDVIAAADFERAPEDTFKLPHPFDVNLALPQEERNQLLVWLYHYNECFSSNSKVHQTPLAKHRVINEGGALPTRQSPYRGPSHEREAIRTQVDTCSATT